MAAPSPIHDLHAARGAAFAEYGAAEGRLGIAVAMAFGPVEVEYAAIRRSAALMDLPQRGVIELVGPDRLEFLHRMITKDVRSLSPGACVRSFWLNRKGRIDADLRVWHFEDRTLLDLDAHAASRTVAGLGTYIVMDDVAIRDISAATHRLAIHGPGAAAAVSSLLDDSASRDSLAGLPPDRCMLAMAGGTPVVIAREDLTGEIGLEVMCMEDAARGLYLTLLERGGWIEAERTVPPDAAQGPTPGARRAAASTRPIGWHAFNIARIEAGTPMYNLDFGTDSLPAESGVFDDRVSLTKGCYLGQEIVARMHARGQVRRRLVGIRLDRSIPIGTSGQATTPAPRQPETGASIRLAGPGTQDPVGAVTSSAISPMLGQTPVCFAAVTPEHAGAETAVEIDCQGTPVRGTIRPSLRFYERP